MKTLAGKGSPVLEIRLSCRVSVAARLNRLGGAMLLLAFVVFALSVLFLGAPNLTRAEASPPTYVSTFGSAGTGDGKFSHPADIEIASNGDLLVADAENDRIQRFSSAGAYLSKFGTAGSGNGQLNRPAALAVASNGDFLVADADNNRIQRFSSAGAYLSKFGSFGSGNGQLNGPEGIAIDSKGNIWVADTYNNRVQKFTEAGTFVKVIGASGLGQLAEPKSIDIAPGGEVFVADSAHDRVVVFNEAGEYLRTFGSTGTGNGQFGTTDGLDIDAQGNVWVGDEQNERVEQFDQAGKYLAQFGTEGTGVAQFELSDPLGIVTDSKGGIWVTDSANDRVQKWQAPASTTTYVSTFGSAGTGDGKFSHPADIEIASNGDLLVADAENDRIQRFSSAGAYLSKFGTAGSGNGQLNRPAALAVASNGDFLVADADNNRIQRFSSAGAYLSKFGSFGSGNGQLNGPEGIAIDSKVNIWVADTYNNRVQKFTEAGTFVKVIGASGLGQLAEPKSIDIAPGGEVFVADSAHDRVVVFNEAGEYLRTFGSTGTGNGQFGTTDGLDIDAQGNVWVGDEQNERVEQFDQAGKYLAQFGTEGTGVAQFELSDPLGIVTGSKGGIWVTDSANDRVQKWQVPGSAVDPVPVAAFGFNEGEGQLAKDSAHGHDGTITGAKWTTEGKYGKALEFDGEYDSVVVLDDDELDLADGFTVETWVQPDVSLKWEPVVTKWAINGWNYNYQLGAGSETPGVPMGIVYDSGWTWKGVNATKALSTGTWSHLALTYDGEDLRLYVNGALVDTEAASGLEEGEGDLVIGGGSSLYGAFDGKIDEVRIYNQPRDVAGLEEDMSTAIGPPPPSAPKLVTALSFNEGKGKAARDSVHSHDATLFNGAKWSTSGKYGGAIELDGTNDYLSIPDSDALDFSDRFSLEAWVRPDVSKTLAPVITKETTNFYSYLLDAGGETAGTPEGFVSDADWSWEEVAATEALPTSAWSHLAMTYDGEDIRFYVDGALVDINSAPNAQVGSGALKIGGNKFEDFFDGRIDEVRLYDGALSQDEIEEDRNLPIGLAPAPVAEAAYAFNEKRFDSAHNHDATAINGAKITKEEGKYGGSAELDGVDDYLEVPDDDELDFTDGFTLESWVRLTTSKTDASVITKETTNFYSYLLDAGGNTAGVPEGFISDADWSWEEVIAAKALATNTWSHLALTYDGEDLRLYVNAELVDTEAAPNAKVGTGALKIGGNKFSDYFKGRIDEVRLYDEALGQGDIEEDKSTAITEPPVPAPSTSTVVTPSEGMRSARRFKLKASWTVSPPPTGVTFQYRLGASGAFKTMPSTTVRDGDGYPVSWPMPVTSSPSTPIYFDATAASALLKEKGGELEIRALFAGPAAAAGYSAPVKVTIDPNVGGNKDATVSVGPGQLSLLTGDLTVTRTGVSLSAVGSSLEFSRTFNSRSRQTTNTSVMGLGWVPSAPVEAAGSEWQKITEVLATAEEKEEGLEDYALVTDIEGYEYAFEKSGGSYITPPEALDFTLTKSENKFTLTDSSANRTVFEKNSYDYDYLPISPSQTSEDKTQLFYTLVGGKRRLNMVVAPSARNVTCTEGNAKTTAGCRALSFSYLPASTWGAPGGYGDRLAGITYYGPSSGTSNSSWEVAKYEYNAQGILVSEWDPRISPALKESYSYVGAKVRLKTITPPGLEPTTLEYGALAGEPAEAGRLVRVKRPSLL